MNSNMQTHIRVGLPIILKSVFKRMHYPELPRHFFRFAHLLVSVAYPAFAILTVV